VTFSIGDRVQTRIYHHQAIVADINDTDNGFIYVYWMQNLPNKYAFGPYVISDFEHAGNGLDRVLNALDSKLTNPEETNPLNRRSRGTRKSKK
jgi:hypothetical protein